MINESEDELPLVKRLDDLVITLCIEINSKFENTVASVIIFDYEQKSVGICMNDNPINSVGEVISRHHGKTRIEINVKIPRINLSKGIYYITFTLTETLVSKPVARLNNIKTFQVTSLYDVWPPFELEGVWYKKSDGIK
jgi:hypothetical protein